MSVPVSRQRATSTVSPDVTGSAMTLRAVLILILNGLTLHRFDFKRFNKLMCDFSLSQLLSRGLFARTGSSQCSAVQLQLNVSHS